MKLTFYLFNESVNDFSEAITTAKFQGEDGFQELTSTSSLPFEAKAYFQKNRPTVPKWLGFIAGYFDLKQDDIFNNTNSFLILVKVRDRFFAITTGFGFTAIDRSKIENGFGLRVALNEINPQKIKGIDVRKIDTTTKQKRVLLNRDSPLYDFDFDLDEDMLNLISGQPRNSSLANKLVGADSLSVTSKMSFDEIGKKCEALLEAFAKDDYKIDFGFIDHLRVVKDPKLQEKLKERLRQAIRQRKTEKLLLAYPEIENLSSVESFKLYYKSWADEVEEVDLQAIYAFLDSYNLADVEIDKFYILGLDHSNQPVTKRFSLFDYVVFETDYVGKKYILSIGRWFEIADDYVQQINADLESIEEITAHNFLPPMKKGQWEGQYNSQASKLHGYALLDKKNYSAGGSSKVEVCDLLTEQAVFICVKKYNGSSTLSHLFSQGFVSASLFDEHKPYREFVANSCPKGWTVPFNLDIPDKTKIVFVFAVAAESSGKLIEVLPFFSKVNLRQCRKAIQKMGFKVKLCKIALI